MKRSALFLDRDGVINEDLGYVHKIEDFFFVKGIFDLCLKAQCMGMPIIIVTNQAGIARGYYSEKQFHLLSNWMVERFGDEGINIDGVYYCPFHPKHGIGSYKLNSEDRKPRPGMIYRAREEHGLDLGSSVLIGDKEWDIAAAHNAGVGTSVLFSSQKKDMILKPDIIADCLIALSKLLFPSTFSDG